MNPGEDMDVCKCIVPLRHGGTLNSRKSSREVGGSCSPSKWGGTELNCTVSCMVLKATDNDRRHRAHCHDEFRKPRSGLCRSAAPAREDCLVLAATTASLTVRCPQRYVFLFSFFIETRGESETYKKDGIDKDYTTNT
ncbi:uncharacterized protein TNCV_4793601 [Trichonephila clavipes]|nr:uncharacterized protein TNCV_4793601 [Trichonephila clavipes]